MRIIAENADLSREPGAAIEQPLSSRVVVGAADVDANTPPVAVSSAEPDEPACALEPPVGAYTLVGSPPVETPPVETPPALDGPVEIPPVETPPAPDVPPAWIAELPPVFGAPPVHDTYTMRVSSRR